jgi:hypothetical protein
VHHVTILQNEASNCSDDSTRLEKRIETKTTARAPVDWWSPFGREQAGTIRQAGTDRVDLCDHIAAASARIDLSSRPRRRIAHRIHVFASTSNKLLAGCLSLLLRAALNFI